MCCGQKRGAMNSQKVEIPANPTARDKGNAPPADQLAAGVDDSFAPIGRAYGPVVAIQEPTTPDLTNNDAQVIVHEAPPADESKEGNDGKRRR